MKTTTLSLFVLILIVIVSACTPLTSSAEGQPTSVVEAEPTVSVEHEATTTSPEPTVAVEATIPVQQCEFVVSVPQGMHITDETPYSQAIAFNLDDPEQGARNFAYVSVISPEIQRMVTAGTYLGEVYNYDPDITEILLSMQVGESKAVREFPNVDSGFTYERKADIQIGGYTVQSYENLEPWEFPLETKEIRYYLSLNDCLYQIGGYMDTGQSDLPGVITEELFNQIVSTIQFTP